MIRTATALALTVGIALGVITGDNPPRCLEDEVRMYEGQCVPLDDITEAAIDLYVEANMQAARR